MTHKHNTQIRETLTNQINRFETKKQFAKSHLEKQYYHDVIKKHKKIINTHTPRKQNKKTKKQKNILFATLTILAIILILTLTLTSSQTIIGNVGLDLVQIENNQNQNNNYSVINKLSRAEIIELIKNDGVQKLNSGEIQPPHILELQNSNLIDTSLNSSPNSKTQNSSTNLSLVPFNETQYWIDLKLQEEQIQLNFANFQTQAFTPCTFSCDSGSLDINIAPECNITTTHLITEDACTIQGSGNLKIRNNGSIQGYDDIPETSIAYVTESTPTNYRVGFIINLTGNLTIKLNGIISVNGRSRGNTDYLREQSAGKLIIYSNELINNGIISAIGGASSTQAYSAAGWGGIIQIKSHKFTNLNYITTKGGGVQTQGTNPYSGRNIGGNGGLIIIQTTNFSNNGYLATTGGTGGEICAVYGPRTIGGKLRYQHYGKRGKGGTINITANNIKLIGNITSVQGARGGELNPINCNPKLFPDGKIYIKYTTSLNQTISDSKPLFWLKPDSLNCNVFDGSKNLCVENSNCEIGKFRCKMNQNKNFKNLTINGGFIDVHGDSLNLNISEKIMIQKNNLSFTTAENFNLHHSGSGTFNLTFNTAEINGSILNINYLESKSNLTINPKGNLFLNSSSQFKVANTLEVWGNVSAMTSNMFINAKNILVKSGGKIFAKDAGDMDSTRLTYNLNSSLINIFSGGLISGTGEPTLKTTAINQNSQNGGVVNLFSNSLIVDGTLESNGGQGSLASPNQWHKGGRGGTINIFSTNLNVSNQLTTTGGDYNTGTTNGGTGGLIKINSSNINIFSSATISASGGIGRPNRCQELDGQYGGRRGNGGTINITTNNIQLSGKLYAQRASSGFCNDGSDGNIFIHSTNNLFTSGTNTFPPFWLQNKACSTPQYGSCIVNNVCTITDISCELNGNQNFKNLTLTNALLTTINNSLSLNISNTFEISLSQYQTPKGVRPTYKLGSGSLNITTKNLILENKLFNPTNLNFSNQILFSGSESGIIFASNNSKLIGPNLTISDFANISIDGSAYFPYAGPSVEFLIKDNFVIDFFGIVDFSAKSPLQGASPFNAGQRSGNLKVISSNSSIFGTILTRGVPPICNSNFEYYDQTGGAGGKFELLSNKISLQGTINSNGGGVCDSIPTLTQNGGNAGSIILSAPLINITGNLFAKGGNGDSDSCTINSFGSKGYGGLINISGTNLTISGVLNARTADLGFCNDGSEGEIFIGYFNFLRRTSSNISPIFWLKPNSHQCNLFDGVTNTCIQNLTCIIDEYRCELEGNKNYDNLILNQGFIDTHNKDIFLNISKDLNLSPVVLNYETIENYQLHHEGLGNSEINTSNLNINANAKLSSFRKIRANKTNVFGNIITNNDASEIFSNNLNIFSGGLIKSSSTTNTNTKFTILVNNLLKVFSNASISTSGINNQHAGALNIFANILDNSGLISANGASDNQWNGGVITLNTSILNNTGNISSKGGSSPSFKGSGGNINLISNSIFATGNFNTQPGDSGSCSSCSNGTTLIRYIDYLNITNANFKPLPNLIKTNLDGTIYFPKSINNSQIFSIQPISLLPNNYTIDSGKNPGLNRYAEIKVTNIAAGLKSIVVLQNYSECFPPLCNVIEYNELAVPSYAWFNVSHWTTYSIQGGGKLVIFAPNPFSRYDENITVVADFSDLGIPIKDAEILLNVTDPDGIPIITNQQMIFDENRTDLAGVPKGGSYNYTFPVTKLGIYNYSVYANKTAYIPRLEFGFFHSGYLNTTLYLDDNNTNNNSQFIFLSGLVQWDNSTARDNGTLRVLINNSFDRYLTTNGTGHYNYSYKPILQGKYPIRIEGFNLELETFAEKTLIVDYIIPDIFFTSSNLPNDTHINQDFVELRIQTTEAHEQNLTFRLYNTSGLLALNFTTNKTRILRWSNLNPNEQYWYNVTIEDFAFNVNTTRTRKITLDNTYPELEFASGTELNDSHLNQNYIFINTTAYDLNEANMTFRLYDTGGLINITTFPAGSRSINWTNLNSNMQYWYNVTILDRASNDNSTKTRKITLDTTFPEIQFWTGTLPSGLLLDNKNWIFVNISAYDLNEANITFNLYNGSNLYKSKFFNTNIMQNKTRNYTFIVHPDDEYFYNVTIIDRASNKNTTITKDIDLDDFAPVVNITYLANMTAYTSSILNRTLNWTLYEQHPDQCWYQVYNNTYVINNSIVYVNCTQYVDTIGVVRGWQNVTFWANDTLGHLTKYFHWFLMNTKPTIPILKLPSNNSWKIYNNFTFDVYPSFDEDGDILKYNYVASTDKNFNNVVFNDSSAWGNTSLKVDYLPDGWLYWKAAAVDPVEASNLSEAGYVDDVQAKITMVLPKNLTVLNAGGTTDVPYLFEVFESQRPDWITDIKLKFAEANDSNSYQMIPQILSWPTQIWKYTHTIPKDLSPRLIYATANASNGESERINYKHTYRITDVNARNPSVDYLCSFPTYVPLNTSPQVNISFSFATLIENMSIDILWTNGTNGSVGGIENLIFWNPLTNNMSFNLSLNFTSKTDYELNVTLTDINLHTTNFKKQFFSRELLNLNLSSDGNMTFTDLCTGNLLMEGNPIVQNISQGVYKGTAYTPWPWLNIDNILIWNASKHFLNYTDVPSIYAPPNDRLVVKMFDLQKISVNFSNATMYLNYSSFIFQIGNETLLELWQCDDFNCSSWTNFPSTVFPNQDVISTQLNQSALDPNLNTSTTIFALLQQREVRLNESVLEAPTPSGGGGATRTRTKQVDKIIEKMVDMSLELVAPIVLYENGSSASLVKLINTGEVNFTSLFFNVITSDGLFAKITPPTTKEFLVTGEEYFIGLGVESLAGAGPQELTIQVQALEPDHLEELKILINVQSREKEKESEVRKIINLTEATFAANPQCLELQELIDIAEIKLLEKDFDAAIASARNAINACKELSATLEQPFIDQPLVIRAESKTGYILVSVGAFLTSFVLLYFLASIRVRKKHDRAYEKQVLRKL